MELRKINFFPVKLTLDDIYALETILNEYFGNCMIKAGCKKFESADDLLSYLRKKSITSYFMQQYCFRKIIFKSTEQEVFQIMLLRSNTIIELPENAIKEGLYKKLIDYLEQRADRTLFRSFMFRLTILLIVLLAIPFSLSYFFSFENLYIPAFSLLGLSELLVFIIFRVLSVE